MERVSLLRAAFRGEVLPDGLVLVANHAGGPGNVPITRDGVRWAVQGEGAEGGKVLDGLYFVANALHREVVGRIVQCALDAVAVAHAGSGGQAPGLTYPHGIKLVGFKATEATLHAALQKVMGAFLDAQAVYVRLAAAVGSTRG